MAILEDIKNSITRGLYANGSLSNRGSGFKVEIFNLKKINFLIKLFENSLEDQWPF